MRSRTLLTALVLAAPLAFGVWSPSEARACGGCFVQQSESTQVSGHRMVLSVSQAETTLWDQITYDGDPSEFAWVLPIHGQVEIGLSSDALFSVLEQSTAVTVLSPQINCNPGGCNSAAGGNSDFGSDGATGGGGVEVIAQEVVGPYETVQLQSSDPAALNQWLTDHGYNVPADVQPVIDSYVGEGFGFLALRLVPGQGIDSMRPVRITSPGATPELPLRMVAAGTGATTPITLWVLGEGRYQPTNFQTFEINENDLVWDWNTQSSNYAALRKSGFDASGGKAWLMEAAEPYGQWAFQQLIDTASYDPDGSGYADELGEHAVENAEADVAKLIGNIPENGIFVSRMSAELSRAALANDLTVGATSDQSYVNRTFYVQNSIGEAPACPPVQPCGDDGSYSDDGNGDSGWEDGSGSTGGTIGASGCGIAADGTTPVVTFAGLAAAVLVTMRRRRPRR